MSLVAIIYCQCFTQGSASAPPFSQELLLKEADGRLKLQLESGDNANTLKEEKHQWEKNCCSHLWRHHTNEWIGDWGDIQVLRGALADVGAQKFPTLLECIPLTNAGSVSPELSALALKEIAVFEKSIQQGELELAALLKDDGDEICTANYKQGRCIYFLDDYEFWLSGVGIKILARDNSQVIFKSNHFTQTLLNEAMPEEVKTLFVDQATGASFELDGDARLRDVRQLELIPHEFHVEKRICPENSFDAILTPLKKAFKASVETSHPVIWA